jgi:cation diffusion facilitator CzcD-associated flavoprotein CzcO
MMSERPVSCIIGAGSSGIAAAKTLLERGLPFDCFEKTDRVGGLWVFGGQGEKTAAYRSLHINTSRDRMQYSDFPMPAHYPDYPNHRQIVDYFESYVSHFGVRDKITFNTGVERAERREDGVWKIRLDHGETRYYDALFVGNGHHWDPRWPEPAFDGTFDGREMHSHDYVDAQGFEDKNVVVVGMGNSAMDIASETSRVAKRVFLSARRGAYVLPKHVIGRPLDQYPSDPRIPWRIRRLILAALVRLSTGSMTKYGLPKPDHKLAHAHPTISDEILNRITHGDVLPKPNIAELRGDRVKFTDGSVEPVDIIVYCTGYRVTFPFFDESFISAPDNDLPLFRHVFKPGMDNLFFLGLVQPLGAIMPISEAQAVWGAKLLLGDYALPSEAEMHADMEAERRRMFKRYVKSKRHTMQIDFDDYLYDLKKEIRRGAKRAMASPSRGALPAKARSIQTEPVTA